MTVDSKLFNNIAVPVCKLVKDKQDRFKLVQKHFRKDNL